VSLPLPNIDAALREMERGLDQLGMQGVSMTCSCFDRSTAEAEFEPLYQEMNRRGAVLNYHPIQNGIFDDTNLTSAPRSGSIAAICDSSSVLSQASACRPPATRGPRRGDMDASRPRAAPSRISSPSRPVTSTPTSTRATAAPTP